MKNLFYNSWPFLTLAILAFTIHLAFLSYPAQVVFDEVHFGKFVGAYFTGQYYFDIHPPLGKLLIAGFAKLAGVNPVFDFEKIGEAIPIKTLFVLRFLPAFFGGLFVLFFSWLAYLLSRDKTAALIAGFLILLDNAFLVQSKFILVDIFMLTFEVLTLCFFLLSQRQKSFSAKWWSYLMLTAMFFGLTISIKWTGLATIGIIGVILLVKIFSEKLTNYLSSGQREPGQVPNGGRRLAEARQRMACLPAKACGLGRWQAGLPENEEFARARAKKKTLEGLVGFLSILVIGFLVYLLLFYIHFKLLPLSGPGDAFMSQPFQQELKYGRENVLEPLSWLQKFIELNITMFTSSANLTATHPFGSHWYAWPLNSKPIYYWNQDGIVGYPDWKAKIYFTGNPLLWWLALLGIIFALLKIFTKKGRGQINPLCYVLILAYFANLLPFILIKRVSFLYHYLPPATFAILLLSLILARFWPKEKKFLIFIFGLILISFFLLIPLSYGWPMPPWLSDFEVQIMNFFG